MAKKILDLFPQHTKGGLPVQSGIKAGPLTDKRKKI